jgi:glycerol-3-phosphate acyltransferase PlsY
MHNILWYLAAYLIGGIPFGYLIAKYFAGINIKAVSYTHLTLPTIA